MPLIRNPWEQDNSNFKPAGGYYDSSANDPSASAYASGSVGPVAKQPIGFVNSDRLLAQNKNAIDANRAQINQVGTDINSSYAQQGAQIDKPFQHDSLPVYSDGDLIQLAEGHPDWLKQAAAHRLADPTLLSHDQSWEDPIMSNITKLSVSAQSNPFNYGLLKTAGAINDNTVPGWKNSLETKDADLSSRTGVANQGRVDTIGKLNTDYSTGIQKQLKGILDQAQQSGLYDPRYFGPIKFGGIQTGNEGGTPEQRAVIRTGLKNIAGVAGIDPNTINIPDVDSQYFNAVHKQKQTPAGLTSPGGSFTVGDPNERKGVIRKDKVGNFEAPFHSDRYERLDESPSPAPSQMGGGVWNGLDSGENNRPIVENGSDTLDEVKDWGTQKLKEFRDWWNDRNSGGSGGGKGGGGGYNGRKGYLYA